MHLEHKLAAIEAATRANEQVAIVAATLPAAQEICYDLADILESSGVGGSTVRRTNGAHAISFDGGGSIVFLSFRSPSRGRSLDRIFVPIGTSSEYLGALLPSLSVSGGPLVGY